MTEITTSHDPRDWREAFETTEHGPELDRIRARVAAARQRGENDALVAVVLDEASKAHAKAKAIGVREYADDLAANSCAVEWHHAQFVSDAREYADTLEREADL